MKLILTNTRVTLEGFSPFIIGRVKEEFSYRIEGAEHSMAFKTGQWDGKECVFKKVKGEISAPSGIAPDLIKFLASLGSRAEIDDRRTLLGPVVEYKWNKKIVLRDYQVEAIYSILKAPLKGHGILSMPIRSGKTKTAAGLIAKIGRRALFVVHAKHLLHQTIESFSEAILGQEIGIIGDGSANLQNITVCTVQSLMALKKRDPDSYSELKYHFDLMITDECHHYRGSGMWYEVIDEIQAPYKVGLSATVFLDSEVEKARGIIWLNAIIGGVQYKVSLDLMVERGYIHKQVVHIIEADAHGVRFEESYGPKVKKKVLADNEQRNKIIVDCATRYLDLGYRVLVITDQIKHIDNIIRLFPEKVRAVKVTGNDKAEKRKEFLQKFSKKKIDILIGTVLGEGVDLPCLEVVINAQGGKDPKDTIQRMRNLTPCAGKKQPILIDFLDVSNKYFLSHSRSRESIYSSFSTFSVEHFKPENYNIEEIARELNE